MIQLPKNAFSEDNIHRAYLECRKGKRGAINTMGFEANLYQEIESLSHHLKNMTYRPSRFVCFYVKKPKLREIFAAHFRDRVVHRLLVNILEPYYERKFIYDSYANRKGKGTHKAVERVENFLYRNCLHQKRRKNKTMPDDITIKKYKKPYYYIQLDIRGYFMEINKTILFSILEKDVVDELLLCLCKTIIFDDPTRNVTIKGNRPAAGVLPSHKTLFRNNKNKGIPIGNLTSQFFANVYLNELDQYVKRQLCIKNYVRYVDDFLLFSCHKNDLIYYQEKIQCFLKEKLDLELKETFLQSKSVYQGIDFLGYYIKPTHTLVRKRVVKNFKQKLAGQLPIPYEKRNEWKIQKYYTNPKDLKQIQASINSYLGHFHKANSYRMLQHLQKLLAPYQPIIELRYGYTRLLPARSDRFPSLYQQVRFWQKQFPDKLLMIQLGNFYYLYGSHMETVGIKYKLKFYNIARIKMYAVQKKHLKWLLQQVKNEKINGVLIKQTKQIWEKIRNRVPVLSWEWDEP